MRRANRSTTAAPKRVVVLGSTGKIGTAVMRLFGDRWEVVGLNSKDFDGCEPASLTPLLKQFSPDVVVNCVAFLGIDSCEEDPFKAMQLNCLFPRWLANASNEYGFVLMHFSTDAVFESEKKSAYVESDSARPENLYGLTKFGGDCFVQSHAKRFYVFRISVQAGPSSKTDQFVEKMIERIHKGATKLRVADDIYLSPSFSLDVAERAEKILREEREYGVYHIANEGRASLYDLMEFIVKKMGLDVELERGSYKDFPHVGKKNVDTPLSTEKLEPLRSWKEAIADYCAMLRKES